MQTALTVSARAPRPSKWLKLRNAFITGLFLLAPLGVCVFVVSFLLQHIGDPASKLFFGWMSDDLPDSSLVKIVLAVVSILIVVLFITALGLASHYLFGRWLLRLAERFIRHVPIFNQVYSTTKQIVNTFHSQQKEGFDKVVMVEFPRAGLYTIGFVTKAVEGEVCARTGEDYVNVFVPTTPMPTNGFLVICKESDLIRLDMSVGDGMKLIISGGAIAPPYAKSSSGKMSSGKPGN